MRKLLAGLAIGGSLTLGAVAPLLVVDAESPAAPTSAVCGPFAGSGPIPGCAFRVDGSRLQITLHNTATRTPPVVCTLTPSGALRPVDTTAMEPGARGTLGASVFSGVARTFVVDCRGGGTGNDHVARQVTIVARAEAPTADRTTPPARRSSQAPPPAAPETSETSDRGAATSRGDAAVPEQTSTATPTTTTTTTTVPAAS